MSQQVARFFKPSPQTDLAEEINALLGRLDRLANLLESGGAPGVPGVPGTNIAEKILLLLQQLVPESIGYSQILPFRKSVAAVTQDEQAQTVSITGVVENVVMAFPAGTQQLVEVRLYYLPSGGSQRFIVPSIEGAFIALDDFTATFTPRFPIKGPGRLVVEWYNYDSLNSHSVPVVVLISPTRLEVQA